MEFKDIIVSEFPSGSDHNLKANVNLFDWLTNEKDLDLLQRIRNEQDKAKRSILKKRLSCITPSGIFSYGAEKNLISHSGIMCIDIDASENPQIKDWEALKQALSRSKNIYFASLSASGNGVFCLFKIAHPEKHKDHFIELERIFKIKGIKIDSACKNVSRLRFKSFDPDYCFNEKAIPFEGLPIQEIKVYRSTLSTASSKDPIEIAKNIISKSRDGEKWKELTKASYLLGGYIGAG